MARHERSNVGDLLRGLGDLIERLSALEDLSPKASTATPSASAKHGFKAVYGLSVRMGGDRRPLVERFGTVGREPEPAAQELREPLVDVFDEGDHVQLTAELPGVEAADVRYSVVGRELSLEAVHGDRRYVKNVTLPASVREKEGTSSYRNGIFELKLPKA